jgi:hypothetical protein
MALKGISGNTKLKFFDDRFKICLKTPLKSYETHVLKGFLAE